MKHDRLEPIIEAICYAYDYGSDSKLKAVEITNMLRPLGHQIDKKSGSEAMYGVIHFALEILKELECTNVINAEESLVQNEA